MLGDDGAIGASGAELALTRVELDFGDFAERTGSAEVAQPAIDLVVLELQLTPLIRGRRFLDFREQLESLRGTGIRAFESAAGESLRGGGRGEKTNAIADRPFSRLKAREPDGEVLLQMPSGELPSARNEKLRIRRILGRGKIDFGFARRERLHLGLGLVWTAGSENANRHFAIHGHWAANPPGVDISRPDAMAADRLARIFQPDWRVKRRDTSHPGVRP